MPDAADLSRFFGAPDQFLLGFGPSNAIFVEMTRDAYHRSIFCDRRISPASPQMTQINLAALCELRDRDYGAAPKISYIFHMAHCGSTLLARALDLKDENIVYREPLVLRQLGAELASQALEGAARVDWARRLRLAATLLGRRYNETGPVIVKGNVPVNFIIGDLMALGSGQPSVVLYFGLEHYLLAILKSQNHRKWLAGIVSELHRGIGALVPMRSGMSAAEAAAALWLAQILIYQEALKRAPSIASLDAELLFNDPRSVLERAFAHFGQPRSAAALDAIVHGDLFTRYSKNPEVAFDNEARLAERKKLKTLLARELEEARVWVTKASGCRIPERLGNPLVSKAAELLERA